MASIDLRSRIEPLDSRAVDSGLRRQEDIGEGGSLFAQMPSPDENSKIPPAKPYHLSWKRRWRKGSSFRSLSPIAKLVLLWIEDNCDSAGVLVATNRQIADELSGDSKRQEIAVMTVYRAVRELAVAGKIVVQQAGQEMAGEVVQRPTQITRCNYAEYQGPVSVPVMALNVTQQSQLVCSLPESPTDLTRDIASSSTIATQSTDSPTLIDKYIPIPISDKDKTSSLLCRIRKEFIGVKGEEMVRFSGAEMGMVKNIRKVCGSDDEVMRRWGLFLRSKFWPLKSVNSFRRAFQADAFLPKKNAVAPGVVPKIDGIEAIYGKPSE
jgi:hypothetical protein